MLPSCSSVALSAHFDTCQPLRDTMFQRSLFCQYFVIYNDEQEEPYEAISAPLASFLVLDSTFNLHRARVNINVIMPFHVSKF